MKTSLKDVAPRFCVARQDGLSWERALRAADEQFGHSSARRALFLWKHLPKGASSRLLEELRLTNTGVATGTGSGSSVTLGVERSPQARRGTPVPQAPSARQENTITIPRWNATLTFWKAADFSSDGNLIGDGVLTLEDIQFAGIKFRSLSFGIDDRLVEFHTSLGCQDGGLTMGIGGNMSGRGGKSYYYVAIMKKQELLETISFYPDLTVMARTVDYPGSHRMEYRETYKEGRLRRRDHYSRAVPEAGAASIIRTEEFQ